MLDVNAADAIAKPFPVAAVVFPTESKISVRVLTSLVIHSFLQFLQHYQILVQKASIANCIAVVAIIDAANATP
jgi:hypothetical protein